MDIIFKVVEVILLNKYIKKIWLKISEDIQIKEEK